MIYIALLCIVFCFSSIKGNIDEKHSKGVNNISLDGKTYDFENFDQVCTLFDVDCSELLNIELQITTSCMAQVPDFSSFLSVSSCSNLAFAQTNHAVGSFLPIGTFSEQLIITNEVSAATSCNFTFEVVDNEPPNIAVNTTHFPVYVEDPNILIPDLTSYVSANESDECNDLIIDQSPPVGSSISSYGDYPISFEASDANGNTSITVSFPLKFRHPGVITPTCPTDILVPTDPGLCSASVSYPLPTVPDRGVIQSQGLPSGSDFSFGNTTVEYYAETMIDTLVKFTWDDPLRRIGAPEIGPLGYNWSNNAFYATNPAGGYAIESPDSLSITMPLEFLDNIKGMELGFEYAAELSRLTDAMNIGPHFEFDLDTNVYIKYKVFTPWSTIETINEQHIFDIPEDDQFHKYLFRYDNRTGIAEIFMDDALMWQNADPIPGSTLYFGSGSEFYIGNDNSNNGTKIDNLFINKYTTNESCSFNVTVIDTNAPVADCPNDTTLYVSDSACDHTFSFNVTGTDDCSGIGIISQLSGLPSGGAYPLGVTSNLFQVFDNAGNSSICSFEVTMLDTIDPVIDCLDPIYLQIDSFACGSFESFPFNVSDNCGIADTTHIAGIINGDFVPLGTHTSTYEFIDSSGNSSQCTYTIIVEDNIAPVIDCTGITVTVDENCSYLMPNLALLAVDNCDSDLDIMQTPIPGTPVLNNAPILPILSATDDEGNNSQCGVNITVSDTIIPVIDCFNDTTIYTEPNLCGANFVYPSGATDNCPDLFFQQLAGPLSGNVLPLGDTQISRMVQDIGANKDSCHFVVTVIDSIKPVLDCSPIMVYDLDNNCQEVVFYDLSSRASDACLVNFTQLLSGPVSGSVFPEGITEIEFMAMDMNGNSDTCSFEIEVLGGINWSLGCPGDQFIVPDGDCGYVLPDYTSLASVTDSCSRAISLLQDPIPGTTVYGNSSVTITAEDDLGTMHSCSFNLITQDLLPPSINCHSDTILYLPDNMCEIEFEYLFDAIDNCLLDSIEVIGTNSGELFNVGIHNISGIAWDAAGLSDTCNFSVTVLDTIAPEFTNCADIDIIDDDGDCFVTATYSINATDICGLDSMVPIAGPLPNDVIEADSIYTIEYQAIDIHGNESTCTFNLNAIGTGLWNFGSFDDQTQYLDDNCETLLEDYRSIAPIITTCASVDLTQNPPPGTIINSNTSITITGTNPLYTEDLNFTVFVSDTINPGLICPTDTLIGASNIVCGAYFNYDIISSDNCGVSTLNMVSGYFSGELFPIGSTSVNYELVDISGNNSQCTFIVEVVDSVAPSLICDSILEFCTTEILISPPQISDGCDWNNLVNSFNGTADASGIYPVGNTNLIWTVQDIHGNESACPQTIIVHEELSDPFAGEDQEIFFGISTRFEADVPSYGIGEWSIIQGGGDIADINDPSSHIENIPVGTNIYEWTMIHEFCPEKSDTVLIHAIDIFIPSGFSPDLDSRNDFFEIKGLQFFPENNLKVYNRWGKIIYEKTNYMNEWDGRDKSGNLLPVDTYYFILEINELRQPYSGFVVIKY